MTEFVRLETFRNLDENVHGPGGGSEHRREGEVSDDEELFTVDEAVAKAGFGKFQVCLSLFAGVVWMVDAMEIMLMSFVSPAARCAFGLTNVQEASITTVVFVGVLCGSPTYGYLCDKYGRHRTLLVSSTFTAVYGLASSFAPNYTWLLILRFLTGFNIAATAQVATYYSEFLPAKIRGVCIVALDVFWAVGTCFVTVLAIGVMPTLGWRYLLGLSAIPLILVLPVFACFPESPHYLMSSGYPDEALKVLQRVTRMNGKSMPPGRLVSVEAKQLREAARRAKRDAGAPVSSDQSGNNDETTLVDSNEVHRNVTFVQSKNPLKRFVMRGRLRYVFADRELTKTLCLMAFIWFVVAFSYYGAALLTPEVLRAPLLEVQTAADGNNVTVCKTKLEFAASGNCQLSRSGYIRTLWVTTAEFPGIFLTILFLVYMDRRSTIRLELALVTLFYSLLLICHVSQTVTLVFLFGVRAMVTAIFQTIYVYTPEVYPTQVRGIGLSLCSTAARFGTIATPYVAEVVFRQTILGGKLSYAAVSAMGFIASCFLTIETKGRSLDIQISKETVAS